MGALTGSLYDVVERPAGGVLTADYASGVTVLAVEDAGDFAPGGGSVVLPNGAVVAYVAADLEADTVTLAAPSPVALSAGDNILTFPISVFRFGLVAVGDDEDSGSLRVALPTNLLPQLALGQRDDDEAETVTVDQDGTGRYVITEVYGEPNVVPTFDDVDELLGDVGGVWYGPTPPDDPHDKQLWFEGLLPDGPFVPKIYVADTDTWRLAQLGDGAIAALSVGKLTAGVLNAVMVVGNVIRTSESDSVQRSEFRPSGFYHYPDGVGAAPDFSATGSGVAITGRLQTTSAVNPDAGIVIEQTGSGSLARGTIDFGDASGKRQAYIRLSDNNSGAGLRTLRLLGPGGATTGGEAAGAFLNLRNQGAGAANRSDVTLSTGRGDITIGNDSNLYLQVLQPPTGGGHRYIALANLSAPASNDKANPGLWLRSPAIRIDRGGISGEANDMPTDVYLDGTLHYNDVPLGTWLNWTPVITSTGTNPATLSATRIRGRFCRIGTTIHFSATANPWAGWTRGSGNYILSLPVAPRLDPAGTYSHLNAAVNFNMHDGTNEYNGIGKIEDGTITRTIFREPGGQQRTLSSGWPAAFGTVPMSTRMHWSGTYEAAE